MATLTVYPDANPETNTVDGKAARTSAGENIATISAGDGTTAADSGATINAVYLQGNATPLFVELDRSIFLFDTSALTAGATISAAVLKLYVSASVDDLTGQTFNVVASAPASNTALAAGDYQTMGTTKFSDNVNVGGQTTSAYLEISLNAAGIAAISKTGITKLGCRLTCDGLGGSVTPSNNGSYLQVNGAEGANKPTLVVTYSTANPQTAAFTAISVSATIPATTASHVAEYIAAFTSITISTTVSLMTASFQAVVTAAFTAISVSATIPATAASWVYNTTAGFSPISLVMSIPNMLAIGIRTLLKPIARVTKNFITAKVKKTKILLNINKTKPTIK